MSPAVGHQVVCNQNGLHMAYVFHKVRSCFDCVTSGPCGNCLGLKDVFLELKNTHFPIKILTSLDRKFGMMA